MPVKTDTEIITELHSCVGAANPQPLEGTETTAGVGTLSKTSLVCLSCSSRSAKASERGLSPLQMTKRSFWVLVLETVSQSVAQTGLELRAILPSQTPKC